MSDRFWPVHSEQEPWFRIGQFEVTTTTLVAAVVVLCWPVWALAGGAAYETGLMYAPELLAGGQLWRLVTWPFAAGPSLWAIIDVAMLWYFGNILERQIGRTRMAWLLAGMWLSITVAYTAVALLFSSSTALAGIGLIQLLVLLLWIAEYPDARMFFNIPAWVIGVVIVGLQVLVMLGNRQWDGLLALALSMAFVAVAARRAGMLAAYDWIPGRPRVRKSRAPKVSRTETRAHQRRASDRERLDELLDQINDQGIGSLTDAQRRELLKLRERLRRD
jgi:membrane associated rhomboid family serine protease